MEVTLESVSAVIRTACDLPPGQRLDEGTLADLGLDSLAQLKLLFELEKGFGLRVPEDMPLAELSLAGLVAFIQNDCRAATPAAAAATCNALG